MKQTRIRSVTVTALLLLLALVLGFAIGSLSRADRAFAATYSPTQIFSAGTGGSVGHSDGDESYVQFTLRSEGSVHFRRDLALKWYSAPDRAEEEDASETLASEFANPGQLHYFELLLSFGELNFKELSFVFESAEENVSKDNTSTNTVVFENDNGTVKAYIKDAYYKESDEESEKPEGVTVDLSGDVRIRIDESGCVVGEFSFYVNDVFVGKINNIGGYFLEYLSSASTTPRVPMTITADELLEGKENQIVLAKELNGQSFKLNANHDIEDNAPPVLVLNEKLYAYTLGKRWNLTYETVDVCDTSVTVNRYYYILKKDADGNYVKPEDDDYTSLSTSTFFVPTSEEEDETHYVSIRFQLSDDSGIKDDGDGYTYLTWYAVDEAVGKVGENDNAFDYILVNRNENNGPYYIGLDPNEEERENKPDEGFEDRINEYRDLVEEASADLSAGDGAYFYLPSLRELIRSDFADYRNLTFSVYYHKQSQSAGASASSATSLSYNSLRFEIDEVGKYTFRILATDPTGNAMQYYLDKELVSLSSSNIWDIEGIPEFSFTVGYTGATIEDPEEQTLGYRDRTYTVSSFDIVALAGFETEYTLYYLDELQIPSIPSYSDLVKNASTLMPSYESAGYLKKINEFNEEIGEKDDRWEKTDNKYHWYPSSLTFMPVEAGYYVVKLVVTEKSMPGTPVSAYQVIRVQNPIDTPPDNTVWLEDNLVSVILFAISALLAVAIIVLLVVKPSEKTVEEVDLEKLKKTENQKSQKKNKK